MLKETLIVPILLGAGIAGGGFTPGAGGIGDPVMPNFPDMLLTSDDGIQIGTDVKALQDGAVYYIKSYLNPNYVISLESNNVTNGDNLVLAEKYTNQWGGYYTSQMFVARKETDSYGNDAWSFSPYDYQSMVLKFSDDLELNDGARDTLSVRNRIEDGAFVNMFQTPERSVFANSFRLESETQIFMVMKQTSRFLKMKLKMVSKLEKTTMTMKCQKCITGISKKPHHLVSTSKMSLKFFQKAIIITNSRFPHLDITQLKPENQTSYANLV